MVINFLKEIIIRQFKTKTISDCSTCMCKKKMPDKFNQLNTIKVILHTIKNKNPCFFKETFHEIVENCTLTTKPVPRVK
jgi:hypothetical protein